MSRRIISAIIVALVVTIQGQRLLQAADISYIGKAANVGAAATTDYDSYGYDLYATTPVGTNTRNFDPSDGPFGTGSRLTELPSFVTSITAPSQNASASGYYFYATLNNPTGGQIEGGFTFAIAGASGIQNDLASISLGSNPPLSFDIGILENITAAEPGESPDDPDYLRLRQNNGAGDSGLISTNKATADFGGVDVYFFQVTGAVSGDSLTLSGVENSQNIGDGNYHATLAGVLFPATSSVPEPSNLVVLGVGIIMLKRRRRLNN